MKFFISSLLCFVLGLLNSQDCNIQITVPDDVTLCDPGYVQLNGTIDGAYFGFDWSGSNGYFNSLSLNNQVWVDETTTFTLKAYGQSEENLIQNPSFEYGNTGFSTLYTYNPLSLWAEGTYTITNNPNSVHSGFTACPAHDGAQMMVLNGSVSLAQIWCQSIPVTPNTNYVFWAWATSVNASNPARLQFSINNNLIGQQMNLSGSLCQWEQFYAVWNSGNQTTADICIVNQNTNPSGNDFALDDLFFGPLCETEESFTVFVEDFDILAEEVPPITCFDPEQYITAHTDPVMTGLTYEWSTWNGMILSDPYLSDIVAGSAGTYTVTVTSSNQCTRTMDFEVTADNEVPDLEIYGNPVLDCNERTSYLEAFTFGNTDADFYWALPGNSYYIGPGFYVNTPGLYSVTATAPNGCSDTASVHVTVQNNSFLYAKQKEGPLTCLIDSVAVWIDNQSEIDSIRWFNDAGQPIWQSFDTLWLRDPGVYYFELREGKYCTIRDSMLIDSLPSQIQYQKAEPDTITCQRKEIMLRLEDVRNADSISWFYQSDLISGVDTAIVNMPGMYYVMLYDSNQCVKKDSVLVWADLALPEARVEVDSIDCMDNLGGFTTDYTGNGILEWSGPSGQSNDHNPVFSREGEYVLKITGSNGCITTDTFFLPSSRDYPSILADIHHITCTSPQGSILISTGRPARIDWTGPYGMSGQSSYINSTVSGTFRIQAVTPQGCMAEITAEMGADTIRPILDMKLFDTITCDKPFVLAEINAADYDSLSWISQGLAFSNELAPRFEKSGLYTLAVFYHNGCFTEKSLLVTTDTIAPVFTAEAEDLSCVKPETRMNITGSDTYTYYSGSDIVQNGHVIQQAGVYVISAIGKNGCRDSIRTEIQAHFDVHDIRLDTVVLNCRQPFFRVSDKNFQDSVLYTWIMASGQTVADSIQISRGEGIVRLQALNGYGCLSEMVVPVTEDFEPPGIRITGNPEIDCIDHKTVLTAESREQKSLFLWTGERDIKKEGAVIDITEPGWYRVVAENPVNGCTDTVSSLVVLEKKPEHVEFDLIRPVCAEDEAKVIFQAVEGGNAPYEFYLDQTLVNDKDVFYLPETKVYHLRIVDSHSCFLDTSFVITYPETLTVDAGKDTIIVYGEEIILQPACSVPWDSLADITWETSFPLNCQNCPFPEITAESDNRFYLHVTDLNGCQKYDSVSVRVRRINGYDAPNVILPSSSLNNRFTIYSLYNSVESIEHLAIYDRWGNLVFDVYDAAPGDQQKGWDGTFNNHPTANGIYMWVARIRYKTGEKETVAGDILVAN